MTQYDLPKELYSNHFVDVLNSKHRYLVCMGGRASTKSHTLILKCLLESFREKHRGIFYCRKHYETIRSTTFKDIINVIKLSGLEDSFSYSTSHNSSMIFKNNITGHQIVPYGLVEAEKTKGISQATHIFVDEITENNKESIDMIDSVLRTPQAEYLQFMCAFNPVDENNFIRSYFFDEKDPYKGRTDYGNDLLIHHSTLENNDFLDKEAYRISLTRKYGHNQNLLDVNLYGLWGKAEVEAPFAQRFDKTKHVKKLEYKGKVYRLSFDFNVNPITCIIATDNGKKAQILKEFRLSDSDIYKLCSEIRSWLPIGCYIEVTGDSTGSNRSAMTQGNINYYDIIEKELRISRRQIRTPTYNIGHENSRALMNSLFIEDLIELDESCKWLIDDLVYCEVLPDGHINKKKNEASNMGHLLDCLRYLLATFYNTRK